MNATNHLSTIPVLVECPRDAMQGWKNFIPTKQKIDYINSLLDVGFDTIDFGSFVSPKAIPQMQDTKEVLHGLKMKDTKTKLLAIVANTRGAEEAVVFDEISYLGFPFSISETFQKRNTNSTIEESIGRVEEVQNLRQQNNKQLVIYLSMGFGNPYGDVYTEDILLHWAEKIATLNIKIISLADTVGLAAPQQISAALKWLISAYPSIQFGVHLHSTATNWKEKLNAAYQSGCIRYDGALKGIGGCPMADDELVGNMNTEWMLHYFEEMNALVHLNEEALMRSTAIADSIFR